MPRPIQYCPSGYAVHVVPGGKNRHACFTCNRVMVTKGHWRLEGTKKFDVAIHGWGLMTNHLYLLLTPTTDQGISRSMQFLRRQYIQSFNFKYGRTRPSSKDGLRQRSCCIDTIASTV
jgi:putative transposase